MSVSVQQQDSHNNSSPGSSPTSSSPSSSDSAKKKDESTTKEEEAVGICTTTKERFSVPLTYDCTDVFTHPQKWTEIPVILELFLIGFYSISFLTGLLPKWFFLVNYIFWRLAYNCGLGYILSTQSNGKQFTKYVQQLVKNNKSFLEANLSLRGKKGEVKHEKYKVDEYPLDFTAWMVYRTVVDIILSSDLAGYIVFCLAYFELPTSIGFYEIVSYAIGVALCLFNIWAKSDAHRVLGDYAWYWGDFFFLLDKNLVFDGIFQMFPHPMYSVGYSFYYGVSIMSRSYTVLVVSFCAHMLQLIFLVFVENPHIEKIYGGMSTPETSKDSKAEREPILFYNLNPFKHPDDLLLVVITVYAMFTSLTAPFFVAICHAVLWRLIHHLGMGYILYGQSKNQAFTKRFTKSGGTNQQAFSFFKRLYNFSLTINHAIMIALTLKIFITTFLWVDYNSSGSATTDYYYEGFSQLMTWQYATQLVAGIILILLNIYQSTSTYEVLGDYGWFYGDFFYQETQQSKQPSYTGIYRYLNNPEIVLGYCAYFGMALIAKSWAVLGLAVLSQFATYLFVKLVEKPHMDKIYGATNLREKGGIELELQKSVSRVASHPSIAALNEKVEENLTKVKKLLLNKND
ncbi:hypothetical protein C9374_007941 [Naegleria lovaniensis]|uniref:Phosphatidylethanolamine N-methyltransferase n=1 Tax=Naegleria lovaniensis TaxID=51637 RepID=A0AA88KIE3_NAELO|nr:uncharacterized protein C9374_007941 [Naegleria lovaniensis]KAG2378793.1 hypothetical protein C9374_007941 [Naegleria lovaniensis]